LSSRRILLQLYREIFFHLDGFELLAPYKIHHSKVKVLS
jgi:hypothetical protein